MLITDLTGSKDGTVRLWEWGHMQCINEPRKPGAFPKVTKVLFNAQGNKVRNTGCSVTLNNASDYRANGRLSDYIRWTNGITG